MGWIVQSKWCRNLRPLDDETMTAQSNIVLCRSEDMVQSEQGATMSAMANCAACY